MIVTVIKDSVIYNGIIFKREESFEADEAIAKSLVERGYVTAVAAPSEDEGEAETISRETELEKASYTELKKLAASMGLSANGKKHELIARIIEAAEHSTEVEVVEEADEISDDLPNTNMPE